MLLAIAGLHWAAGRTDQLLGIELLPCLGVVHGLGAALTASEVGLVALEALEVGVDCGGVLLFVLEVGRRGVTQHSILVCSLVRQSLHDLLPDLARE